MMNLIQALGASGQPSSPAGGNTASGTPGEFGVLVRSASATAGTKAVAASAKGDTSEAAGPTAPPPEGQASGGDAVTSVTAETPANDTGLANQAVSLLGEVAGTPIEITGPLGQASPQGVVEELGKVPPGLATSSADLGANASATGKAAQVLQSLLEGVSPRALSGAVAGSQATPGSQVTNAIAVSGQGSGGQNQATVPLAQPTAPSQSTSQDAVSLGQKTVASGVTQSQTSPSSAQATSATVGATAVGLQTPLGQPTTPPGTNKAAAGQPIAASQTVTQAIAAGTDDRVVSATVASTTVVRSTDAAALPVDLEAVPSSTPNTPTAGTPPKADTNGQTPAAFVVTNNGADIPKVTAPTATQLASGPAQSAPQVTPPIPDAGPTSTAATQPIAVASVATAPASQSARALIQKAETQGSSVNATVDVNASEGGEDVDGVLSKSAQTPFTITKTPSPFTVNQPQQQTLTPQTALPEQALTNQAEAPRLEVLQALQTEARPIGQAVAAEASSQPKPVKPFAEALISQVKAVDVTDGRTTVNLHPRGLGAIEIEVLGDKDLASKVVVRVENPAVLQVLRDDRQMLAQAIGIADSSVMEFQNQGSGAQAEQHANGSDSGPESSSAFASDEAASLHTDIIADGNLNILT